MIRVRLRAPYAAFRPFMAGWYRPTAAYPTPSALYGLLLNVAAIESRRDDVKAVTTLTTENLPTAELAIGLLAVPQVQRLYQQVHNYPVGSSGKEREERAHGSKYNIQPVHRELLADLDLVVAIRGEQLERRIRDGLRLGSEYMPEGNPRYGLPFLGDNNFIPSVLREEDIAARWLVRVVPGDPEVDLESSEVARLTVWIDRENMARTVTDLYRPADTAGPNIPETAWTRIPPEQK